MGIIAEFSPELPLRDYSEFENGNRKEEECVPKNLEAGKVYDFLKSGQRIYWLNDEEYWKNGEMPLTKTNGKGETTRPCASIKMLEVTHFLDNGNVFTKGKYKVIEVFDINDPKINFESCMRVK
jgi:hypothetical protein|tara:strand:- start:1609 stop:1980 length:372 start_codon:yes stop_codon:yes gene_type:complete